LLFFIKDTTASQEAIYNKGQVSEDGGPLFVTLRRDFDAASREQMNNSLPPGQYGVKEDVVL